MDGFEFLNLKRQSAKLNDIQTLIMSGEESLNLQIYDEFESILSKPLNMSSVVHAVERMFEGIPALLSRSVSY